MKVYKPFLKSSINVHKIIRCFNEQSIKNMRYGFKKLEDTETETSSQRLVSIYTDFFNLDDHIKFSFNNGRLHYIVIVSSLFRNGQVSINVTNLNIEKVTYETFIKYSLEELSNTLYLIMKAKVKSRSAENYSSDSQFEIDFRKVSTVEKFKDLLTVLEVTGV